MQFQSTLSQREWRNTNCHIVRRSGNFNPHSHKESDLTGIITSSNSLLFQSTLSQREWLRVVVVLVARGTYFNPHSHKESDAYPNLCDGFPYIISIHTLTKRVTSKGCGGSHWGYYFNPHSHKESDDFDLLYASCLLISIHTLTKRVTYFHYVEDLYCTISIHTLTKRVTIYFLFNSFVCSYFNPHSHAGSD